jgi:hypothetical protein
MARHRPPFGKTTANWEEMGVVFTIPRMKQGME